MYYCAMQRLGGGKKFEHRVSWSKISRTWNKRYIAPVVDVVCFWFLFFFFMFLSVRPSHPFRTVVLFIVTAGIFACRQQLTRYSCCNQFYVNKCIWKIKYVVYNVVCFHSSWTVIVLVVRSWVFSVTCSANDVHFPHGYYAPIPVVCKIE